VIIFRNVQHSIPRIEMPHHRQKFLDDPILLSSPYVVQSDVSPEAFTYFMEILGGAEAQISPETVDNLMLLAREFGDNKLITSLTSQRDVPRREGSVHELLREVDRSLGGTTIEAKFHSIRDGIPDVQRRLSIIKEKFDGKLEASLSELEKMTELAKQLSQKGPSNQ
jgi:hypothetical protein